MNRHRAILTIAFAVLITASVGAQPRLVLNTSAIDFGNVQVGQSGWTTFLLTNIGTDTLFVNSITVTNNSFVLTHGSSTIAPSSSFVDTLLFLPTVFGPIVGQVVIASNDSASPAYIPVTGFGLGGGVVDVKTQGYRDDVLGNVQYRKEGVMDGNRIITLFKNDAEVGHWPFEPSCVWPKGTDHSYLDGVALLIGAKIVAPGNRQVVTPIVSAYREEVSTDPVTGKEWVLQPVPGYVNPSSERPAINTDPTTWPEVWPRALDLPDTWNGYWYGYFGRGVSNADFETFFVMDDSQDKKFSRIPFSYYPIAADSARAGLGMRVEVRGFQWSHVLAEDIIFWHYDIVNLSDRNYDTTCFGFYTDPGVGGTNNSGNSARYDTKLDLTYAWCTSGLGTPGNYKTGYVGYAYLESPGNPWNGIDDDEDGMVDERRDDNIDNNHNWLSFSDVNNNGVWDPREPLNDDVGRDGVGPQDPQYTGRDEGEGDGIPTHGEPDFDETDKDESDQIGLQAVSIYILADKGPTGGWPKNDDVMWGKMNNGFRDTVVNNTNISMVFSSGPFPWKQTRRERFSMALVFGDDLNALIFNKETVQNIYNANYNFSKPPYTPHLTAVPGDGKVFLYWDTIAEASVDRYMGFEDPSNPSLGYKRIFEGYTVYRSTDPDFNDVKLITDSQGHAKYYQPIAQFDLIDSVAGPDPVGINGARFWRGAETGLQHSYIDGDVSLRNGTRYFYAVCSYSKGDPKRGTVGLAPTECPKAISTDFAGNIKFVSINCAVVTPIKPAAGYKDPTITGDLSHVTEGIGTGSLKQYIFNPAVIREGDQYTIRFTADNMYPAYKTLSCTASRLRDGISDTVLKNLDWTQFGADKFTLPFDGLVLSVLNDTVVSIDTSYWQVAGTDSTNRKTNVIMPAIIDSSNAGRNVAWPGDYRIDFSASIVDTAAKGFPTSARYPVLPVNFTITNTTSGQPMHFVIDDADRSNTFSYGDTIRILDGWVSLSNFKIAYKVPYLRPYAPYVVPPQPGDQYVIKTKKPFYTGDYFIFTVHKATTDAQLARSALNQITVVPNPYIASATWEPRSLYTSWRADRRIFFMKLPAKCTIRIYTIAGTLVKTLYKDTAPSDGSLSWNLINEDDMDIAYGLYIFHVQADGIGEYIGKFAVVK